MDVTDNRMVVELFYLQKTQTVKILAALAPWETRQFMHAEWHKWGVYFYLDSLHSFASSKRLHKAQAFLEKSQKQTINVLYSKKH